MGQVARRIGRYEVLSIIGEGGMATVRLGRLAGPGGFSRVVAVKELHPFLARDPQFSRMFLDEARLAARIHHPNVVPTLDVISLGGELALVMEYVPGESLARIALGLHGRGERMPPRVASAIIVGVLEGLHAAHEVKGEDGKPLSLVHRDVSPQNILVGADGVARLLDFGVAKAAGRLQTTDNGNLKGKLAYMAPEQLQGKPASRRSDVYAAGVVLWELLTGRRLFDGDNQGALMEQILGGFVEPPSGLAPGVGSELDAVILKALDVDPAKRFSTAREASVAVEEAVASARPLDVSAWLDAAAGDSLRARAAQVAEMGSGVSANVATLPDTAAPRPITPPRASAARAGAFAISWPAPDVIEVAIEGYTTVEIYEKLREAQRRELGQRKAKYRLLNASKMTGYEPMVGSRLVLSWRECQELGIEEHLFVRSARAIPNMRNAMTAMEVHMPANEFESREEALAYAASRRARE